MTGNERSTRTAGDQRTRVFGIETEYGFAALGADGERLDQDAVLAAFMGRVRELVPHLYHSGVNDLFTSNGSRVYLDAGSHPEVATPECSTPEEAVAYTRAGDRLLIQAAQTIDHEWSGEKVEVVLWKANVDHATHATWASHESYLHRAPQSHFAQQLMSHLVSRVVYTGAGGFDNRWSGLRFVLSPRVYHLEQVISGASTYERGIFHTRNESLAASPNRRLHVLAGESLWSETADYLRVGTTALLVAMIDAGRRPQQGLELESPLEAISTFAADVTCRVTAALKTSGALTACAIQRRLLECVEDELGTGYMPLWAAAVCRLWRSVLDRLESHPDSLIGVLDWPTKLAVLRHQCQREGQKWHFSSETDSGCRSDEPVRRPCKDQVAAKLLETDMRFNRLDESGIFTVLDRDGALDHRILSDGAIEQALHQPPATGRARVRASAVTQLTDKGRDIVCNWEKIVDDENDLVLDLGDPFQSEGGEWKAASCTNSISYFNEDSTIEPIREAFNEDNLPEALCRMSALLNDSEPFSISLCRYCVDMIDSLVPAAPVPLIPGGDALGSVLERLLYQARTLEESSLEHRAGWLLYRFHEANGRYEIAIQLIEQLLDRAREAGDHNLVATLSNNLGYEYFLNRQWAEAKILFEQTIEMLEHGSNNLSVANSRASLLECHFASVDADHWIEFLPALVETNLVLVTGRDWRARKTLRLLARFADHRGRWSAARGWARRAVNASKGVKTQLHKWDREYLRGLEVQAHERSARI